MSFILSNCQNNLCLYIHTLSRRDWTTVIKLSFFFISLHICQLLKAVFCILTIIEIFMLIFFIKIILQSFILIPQRQIFTKEKFEKRLIYSPLLYSCCLLNRILLSFQWNLQKTKIKYNLIFLQLNYSTVSFPQASFI